MSIKFVLKRIASDSTVSTAAEYVFDGSLCSIGSDAGSAIVIAGSAPEQAVVIREGEQLTLINGADGTFFNNRQLRREAMEPLAPGDQIRIGNHIIFLVAIGAAADRNGSQRVNYESKPSSIYISAERAAPLTEIKIENPLPASAARNGNAEMPPKKPTRNFADMLNALRTEEDSFYFIVENGTSEAETRLPLEQAETPIGLNASGQISAVADQIAALYVIVRKDWSGIVVESQRSGAVFVNDEAVKTIVRLRNGDRLTFNSARKNNKNALSLELHEPSSLVALESILETRSRNEPSIRNLGGTRVLTDIPEVELPAAPPVPIFERRFFGFFSFFEVIAMAVGTLIAAVLIFLLLEFMV